MGVITPDSFDFFISIYLLIYTVVGGSQNSPGVAAGPLVLTLIPEVSRVLKEYGPNSSSLRCCTGWSSSCREGFPICLERMSTRMGAILQRGIKANASKRGSLPRILRAFARLTIWTCLSRRGDSGHHRPKRRRENDRLQPDYRLPSADTAVLHGREHRRPQAASIARLGITRTFQLDRIFHEFTVLENVAVASHLHAGIGFSKAAFNTPRYRKKDGDTDSYAAKILQLVGMDDKGSRLGKISPMGTRSSSASRSAWQPIQNCCSSMNPWQG